MDGSRLAHGAEVVIRAPFPYFGGKALAAELIWSRLGADIGTFVEPFAGSCAVALNRPKEFDGRITLNDLDGHITNVWRSMIAKPGEVAEHACHLVNECDLHARHLWLVNNRERLTPRLMADPDYCEPRAAGWWAWGACTAIAQWCSGDGPWQAIPGEDGVLEFQKINAIKGIQRMMPHVNGFRGVHKSIPALTRFQCGIHCNTPGGDRLTWLTDWFRKLSSLLNQARVMCGSWERVCSIGTMTQNGVAGVLLDPPYSLTGAVYAKDSRTVSGDVREWCKANGDNPMLRIALCGHTGEGHEELEVLGWQVETWAKGGGYQGKDDRERIWFSPHCLKPKGGLFEFL